MEKVKEQDQAFGLSTKELYRKLSLNGSLSKMYEICSVTDLLPSSKILAKSGMLLNGKLFQRGPLVPVTFGRESGLLPTPTSAQYGTSQNGQRPDGTKYNNPGKPSLETMARNGTLTLPTPTTFDSGPPLPPRKKNPSGGQSPPLNTVIGGRLCPRLVEFMMGLPTDYTSVIESKESNNSETELWPPLRKS